MPQRRILWASRRRTLIGALAFCLWWPPRGDVHADETRRFSVAVRGGRVADEQRTLRVREGDRVEIAFTSDRALLLHLHGIDIETTVTPGRPGVMAFDAAVTGRFPVEAHNGGGRGGLVYVEIHPR